MPAGLRESDRLPQPIFTPATKAESGHDENISEARAAAIVGEATLARLKALTLAIYARGVEHAASRGIILADTKFEFGIATNGETDEILLIDEVMTPDSSRFWPADGYAPGGPATQLRQAVRARPSRGDPLEQAAAGAVAARRGGGADPREVSRRLPPPDRTGPRMTIRQQIDGLVREMVDKGILYEDASREFEGRFISVALEEEGGSIGRAAERIGMHRNTLSRKIDEYKIKKP